MLGAFRIQRLFNEFFGKKFRHIFKTFIVVSGYPFIDRRVKSPEETSLLKAKRKLIFMRLLVIFDDRDAIDLCVIL